MADIRVNSKDAFFGKKNEALLDKLLTDDFQRRLGTNLSPKETTRLNNTVAYNMDKVYEIKGYLQSFLFYRYQYNNLSADLLIGVDKSYLSYRLYN